MKKTILLSALAVAGTMTAGAKTADQLRVYINPGHGSWTPNDRPCTLVGHEEYSRYNTDTTNFFETNTNLRKGFGVLERLIDYGLKFDRTLNQEGERWQIGAARDMTNNIVMSHVKCGPYHDDNGTKNQLGDAAPEDIYYYNRDLTEVSKEVDSNNFDMFISIHSNAATEGTTTNYPLFLYRGYDSPKEETGVTLEHQQTSRTMADNCWGYAIENPFMVWTSYSATNKNLRGDINFYGGSSTSAATGCKGYLGVLKHHVPGFLVEGYFHTYQPARHRAMNWDVSRLEGIGYARGIADYFGLEKESFGTIYGIVRDLHEKFTDPNYKPNPASNDVWKPINGCTVTLLKDGEPIAEYTTDEQYNGAYVFDRIEPGTYTLTFEHPDYKEIEPVEVVVEAAKNTYPLTQLEATDWEAPTKVYEVYPDPAAEVTGIKAADEYAFAADYTDQAIPELEGKIVRRAIVQEGKMYILAIDKLPTYAQVVADEDKPTPTVLVYDLAKKEVVANVSTEGTYGSIQNVADIQVTADGFLIANCQTKNQYSATEVEKLPDGTPEPRGTMYVYKWANDENGLPTGKPEQWLSTTQTGRWYRTYAGSTIAYSGTTEDGRLIVAQPSITAPNHVLRWTVMTVTNGVAAGNADILHDGTTVGDAQFGQGYRFVTSPVNTDNYLIVGPEVGVTERAFLAEDKTPYTYVDNAEVAALPGTVGAFKYAGASYLVAPATADGNNIGLRLVDITNNVDKAVAVSTTNTTLEGIETTNVATAGEVEATYDDLNNVYTAAWINLYVLRDGKITKLTTKNVQQPVHKAEFAYGLDAQKGDGTYDFTYSLTGDAVAATLVLTPETGDAMEYAVDATKGQHSFSVNDTDFENDTKVNWAIKVESKRNGAAGEVFSAAAPQAVRGSVITFTDPEYDTYGYTVIGHNVEDGFDIYNPAGDLVATNVHKGHALHGASGKFNQSNPLRGAEHMGHALVAAWGDAAWGVTAFNPLDTSEDLYSVFEGDKASSGLITYNGVGIGGGTPCVAIQGKGENARMFTFDEDLLSNSVAVYNIGANRTVNTAPANWGRCGLNNTNVEIVTTSNGIFASQVRADFMDSGSQSLIFIDNDGNAKWYAWETEWPSDMITNCNSGLAVNADEDLLAVSSTTAIRIFGLSFNDKNVPVFENLISIPVATAEWATMRFDAANNLHYYGRGTGYHVYALNTDKNVATTPAKEAISVLSGVDNIAVDAEATDAPAVYYNLNGVRVPADNLVPGVYVKVVGKTTTKVVIK